jgi:hypothetical protein
MGLWRLRIPIVGPHAAQVEMSSMRIDHEPKVVLPIYRGLFSWQQWHVGPGSVLGVLQIGPKLIWIVGM